MVNDQQPVVSVIIPNYNHAAFLKQRIESILQQTYQDFELIILDDCSTDYSKQIIERYRSSPKISHIIYNEQNSGSTFKQWVKGLELARGRYIWFAESDDWCEPTLLEYLVEGMEKNAGCAVAYCQLYAITNEGKILWQSTYPHLNDYQNGKEFIKNHMVYGCAISNASMAIWRKELYKQIPADFLEYRYSGDWLFWISLCQLGEVFITGRVLNYFRYHEGDVSTLAKRSGGDFMEQLSILLILWKKTLITREHFYDAWRRKHREYWGRKQLFDASRRKELDDAFYKPLPLTDRFKVKADAAWKSFRMRLKK